MDSTTQRLKSRLVGGAFELTEREIDRFITATFGQEFSIVADQEAGNDTTLRFEVSGRTPALAKWDDKELAEFRNDGRGTFMAQLLLDELCSQGVIPAGRYYIEICW